MNDSIGVSFIDDCKQIRELVCFNGEPAIRVYDECTNPQESFFGANGVALSYTPGVDIWVPGACPADLEVIGCLPAAKIQSVFSKHDAAAYQSFGSPWSDAIFVGTLAGPNFGGWTIFEWPEGFITAGTADPNGHIVIDGPFEGNPDYAGHTYTTSGNARPAANSDHKQVKVIQRVAPDGTYSIAQVYSVDPLTGVLIEELAPWAGLTLGACPKACDQILVEFQHVTYSQVIQADTAGWTSLMNPGWMGVFDFSEPVTPVGCTDPAANEYPVEIGVSGSINGTPFSGTATIASMSDWNMIGAYPSNFLDLIPVDLFADNGIYFTDPFRATFDTATAPSFWINSYYTPSGVDCFDFHYGYAWDGSSVYENFGYSAPTDAPGIDPVWSSPYTEPSDGSHLGLESNKEITVAVNCKTVESVKCITAAADGTMSLTLSYFELDGTPFIIPQTATSVKWEAGACPDLVVEEKEVCVGDIEAWLITGRNPETGEIVWSRMEDINGNVITGQITECLCPPLLPLPEITGIMYGKSFLGEYFPDKWSNPLGINMCPQLQWEAEVWINGISTSITQSPTWTLPTSLTFDADGRPLEPLAWLNSAVAIGGASFEYDLWSTNGNGGLRLSMPLPSTMDVYIELRETNSGPGCSGSTTWAFWNNATTNTVQTPSTNLADSVYSNGGYAGATTSYGWFGVTNEVSV